MYAAGELVVYGGEGVCRVEGVGAPSLPGMDKTRLYYTLSPLYRSGQVMTPVDTQVLMRPLLTAEETAQIIAELDQLPEEQAESHSMRAIKDLYHQVLTSYDCRRLAGLIKGVCRRRSWAVHHGRKISQMDERYLKRAEDALYGELGAVLGLPREEVHPENLAQMAVILTRRSSDGPALPAGPFLCAETIRRRTESRFSA